MLYRTRNGRYQVNVATDGAIRVKPNDWLSKYSAAIHNNFTTVREYARKDRSGKLVPIQNLNLIYAGETLYHLPTYRQSREITFDEGAVIIGRVGPSVTDLEKKKIIIETLKKDFDLKGDQLPIVSKVIDIIGYVDNAGSLAEVAGLLTEGSAAAGAATAVSWLSVALVPIGATIAIVNAGQTGLRHVGMRAIAYATTAWAFDDPIPAPVAWIRPEISQSMIDRAKREDPSSAATYDRAAVADRANVSEYRKAWNDAARSAVANLDAAVVQKKVQKTNYQALYRAIGENDKDKLAMTLMKGLEQQLSAGSERQAFWAPPPHYPDR
jgi:hypothetical protein